MQLQVLRVAYYGGRRGPVVLFVDGYLLLLLVLFDDRPATLAVLPYDQLVDRRQYHEAFFTLFNEAV